MLKCNRTQVFNLAHLGPSHRVCYRELPRTENYHELFSRWEWPTFPVQCVEKNLTEERAQKASVYQEWSNSVGQTYPECRYVLCILR